MAIKKEAQDASFWSHTRKPSFHAWKSATVFCNSKFRSKTEIQAEI